MHIFIFLKNLTACHKNPRPESIFCVFRPGCTSRSDLMRASFATTAIIRAAPSRTAGISAALATLERYTHELGTALVALERHTKRQIEWSGSGNSSGNTAGGRGWEDNDITISSEKNKLVPISGSTLTIKVFRKALLAILER